jgi:hypothetical protein
VLKLGRVDRSAQPPYLISFMTTTMKNGRRDRTREACPADLNEEHDHAPNIYCLSQS